MALDSLLRGYRTLARQNPYGSLGPSPRTVRRITPPPKRRPSVAPAAPPPAFDPFAAANQSVQALLDQMLAEVQAQQDAARAQAEQEAQFETQRGKALAQGLQQLGISQAIQNAFQNAGSNQAALAQGYSGAIRDQAAADAAVQQHLLSGTGQEGAVRNQGENMGNVTYGVGGAIPASSLNTAGAAFGAQAALQPGFAEQIGAMNAAQRRNEFVQSELPAFLEQRLDIIGQKPEMVQDFLSRLASTTGSTEEAAKPQKLTTRTLANGQVQFFNPYTGKAVGKPQGPPRPTPEPSTTTNKVTYRTLANGQIQRFAGNGKPMGKPIGPPRAAAKKAKSKGYNLQFKDFGSYHQWVDPRTTRTVGPRYADPKKAPKPRGRPDEMTATQVRAARGEAFQIVKGWNANGRKDDDGNGVLPKDLLKYMIQEQQIPFDIAVRALAKFFRPARKWYKDQKAVSNAGPQNAALVQDALDLGPRSAAKGVRYHFGAAGPDAYDCSGYTMVMVERQTGVQLPHNAAAQFNDPRGIPVNKKDLQPGDVVFFRSSPNSGSSQPPWHCGYYIGGGRYVEYYSEGKPARTSLLSSRSDYMGARRFGVGGRA